MNTPLRIGTRDSLLALWQAHEVRKKLEHQGIDCRLVPIKSPADLDLNTPLHRFGTTGIFTKMLDVALWEHRIDVAVHSLKDYPTIYPRGIRLAAVLARGPHSDLLLHRGDLSFLEKQAPATIATGSIRRKAQWLHRYPHHQITGLRGNVQTRLRKFRESQWQGAIFARAGLQRVELLPEHYTELDWMIPAPAQGVIGITCRDSDREIQEVLGSINHTETHLLAQLERDFLNEVEGGCSAPVGARAQSLDDNILLHAGVFSPDGREAVILQQQSPHIAAEELGRQTARKALQQGARDIMDKIKDAR